jgi:hypothetical protein
VAWNVVFVGVAFLTAGVGVAATTDSEGWRYAAWGLIVVGAIIAAVASVVGHWQRSRNAGAAETRDDDADEDPPALLPDLPPPLLEIGRAHLPREAQFGAIEGFSIDRPARLIQVPVTNGQGAGEATAVHAELTFMPDEIHRTFAPRDPAVGEWIADGGPVTRIDLPGNGQVHLLNVAVVFNDGYPCIYEWTRRSRDANLHGYGMWSNGVDVDIAVRAAGPSAPSITRRLRIEVINGLIHADWQGEDRSNWVGITGLGWQERGW